MAKDMSCARVKQCSAASIGATERHNERLNTDYANVNVVQERIPLNVHYRSPPSSYMDTLRTMEAAGTVSTRGLRKDATLFDEIIIDVNTMYFERNGGYEYAKKFYEEAYHFLEKKFGSEYVVAAVMHADEINKAATSDLGKDVYHYHLHAVVIPVVDKDILWSKRCKDPALRGTVRETIHQVSHSKKWASNIPLKDEQGQPVLRSNGKPKYRPSYSILQDELVAHIMTSKSPVRSCEDVDATALSFAEIKALCAGDPRIKERMDLDIEVSKLKIMKADHNSKQFRLEDSLLKYFPEKIEEHKGFVRGLEADMQTLAAHPLPAEGFVGMEIRGDRLTDKENAGAALLDTCKEVKGKDPVQIGSYRGFTMSVAFDSMWKTYTLTLKGQMTHRVELGSDARGNLVRIENALDKMPERLRSVQEQLENLYNQQAAAKDEVGKPFPQEQELAAKTARLIELDMELNLDGKGQPQPEQAIAKSTRPSVLDRLKAPPVHGAPEKPHKKEMEAR